MHTMSTLFFVVVVVVVVYHNNDEIGRAFARESYSKQNGKAIRFVRAHLTLVNKIYGYKYVTYFLIKINMGNK